MPDDFLTREWAVSSSQVLEDMGAYLQPFCTPVVKAFQTHGELIGSGAYVEVRDQTFVLTNEHVATKFDGPERPAHQFFKQKQPRLITGRFEQNPPPVDAALMPVNNAAWQTRGQAKSFVIDQICNRHAPFTGEMLVILGFSQERSKQFFSTLSTPGLCYICCEMKPIDNYDTQFVFDVDFRPDFCENMSSSHPLPKAHGLSGSVVWNTGFIQSRTNGVKWTPDLAMVTGQVCRWVEDQGRVVATRSEHIKPWLTNIRPHL